MSLLRRSVPTLRSISVATAVRLVGVIALLGVVTTGVTQYQRHLFEQSTTAVEEASRALGAVDRALIESAALMLEVLYRPRDGEGLESGFADYRAASDRADEAFRRAAEVLAGTGAASELELAQATWDDVDAVVRASPDEWTNEMIYAAVEANADPWVATVWAPYDELNQQMAAVRAATVDELQQQSVEVASIQRVLVVVVLLVLVVAVLLSVLTLRRVSRQVLEPLARVGVSARSLHTPEGYRPAEVPGAVAEVRALAATIDQTASSLHVHQVELRQQALTDLMTGLPNREAFGRELRRRLDSGCGIGVLFVDLDDFKHVNDTIGHAAGDALLTEVAARLRSVVGDAGLVARLGGDEFAVVVDTDSADDTAVELADRIQAALTAPVELGSHLVAAGCSIGVVSRAAGESSDADALLSNADFAMYLAKSRGKGRHEVYSAGVHTEMTARMELARELCDALPLEQFVLHYQPILDVTDGRVLGLEALVRWIHPVRGIVPPNEFIPLAEETGAIVEIGRWVLERSCATLAQLLPHHPGLMMCVNVSPKQLEHRDFVAHVRESVAEHGLSHEQLVLEITEATAMTSTEEAAATLAELRGAGVHVALDDFGTGFSSLRYLGELPADILKVDRSFMGDEHEPTEIMLETVIQLAVRLGLMVVVEGIESEHDLARVQRLGHVAAQGYYFARPMPFERVLDYVRAEAAQRV